MKIHRSRPVADFLVIPNDMLRDERLSFAARGHLAYLLSLPDGWHTTADDEAKRARALRDKRGEGRDAMRRIYTELKNAGYIRYERKQDNGTWSTEIHVFDRPRTDIRLTDVPETRMSVPPAQTPRPVENPPGMFSQLAPMYGSPGVGSPDVGSPVHRSAVHYYENGATEDGGRNRVGDLIADKAQPRDHDQGQGQEQPIANSQNQRVHDGPGTVADDDQHLRSQPGSRAQLQTVTRARDAGGSVPRADDFESAHPGALAAAVGRNPPPAAPDATRRRARWRSPQEIAAEQVAESRARREAAERQAGTAP